MVAKEVGLQVATMVARVVTMVALAQVVTMDRKEVADMVAKEVGLQVAAMVALAQVVTMDGKEVSDMVAEEMALMMYPAYSTTPTSMLLARNISDRKSVV